MLGKSIENIETKIFQQKRLERVKRFSLITLATFGT